MKRLLLTSAFVLTVLIAGPAMAADLRQPVPVPVPVAGWTGFYIGAHIGAGLGTNDWTNVAVPFCCGTGTAGTGTTSGFIGGGQIGYNWQVGCAVIGVEGDFTGATVQGDTFLRPATLGADGKHNTDWFATVTGRLGAVVHGDTLVFVKGGGAWEEDRYNIQNIRANGDFIGSYPEVTDGRFGWTVGMGAEYRITSNWSVKLEYNFMDFGTKTVSFPEGTAGTPLTAAFSVDIGQRLHVFKVGLNYIFAPSY